MSPPTPLPAEASRIVRAARGHFLAHGFRGVTMDDLATELGMSKKTLYAHFASKAALLEAVLEDKFRAVEAEMQQVSGTPHESVLAALQALLEVIRRQVGEIQPAFVRDIRREAPEMFHRVEAFRRELVQKHFGRLFTEGRKAGVIRRDLPVKLMVEILVAATDAIVNPARVEELGLTPKAAYMAVLTLFMEGAMTRPGGAR